MCDTEAISLQHLRTYSYYKQCIRPSASILNHEKYSFIDASFLVPNYKEHSRLLPYSPVPPTPTERCVAFAQALPAATSLCSCYLNLKQKGACGGRGEWITAACMFSFETSVFFPPTMHLNAQLSFFPQETVGTPVCSIRTMHSFFHLDFPYEEWTPVSATALKT